MARKLALHMALVCIGVQGCGQVVSGMNDTSVQTKWKNTPVAATETPKPQPALPPADAKAKPEEATRKKPSGVKQRALLIGPQILLAPEVNDGVTAKAAVLTASPVDGAPSSTPNIVRNRLVEDALP